MELIFASNSLEHCADDQRAAAQQWGHLVGRKYVERIRILRDVPSFDGLRNIRALRLHRLAGRRQEQYAIDLTGAFRLILRRGSLANELIVLEVSNHYDR